MYIPSYVTIEQLKGMSLETSEVSHDAMLKRFCLEASKTLETLAYNRRLAPHYDTKYFDLPEHLGELRLGHLDLLEVDTFTTNNDNTTVSASDYFLMAGCDYNVTPYNIIAMDSSGSTSNLLYSGTPQRSQKVAGWWGYVEDWGNAWETTQRAVSSISGNTLTVDGNVDELTLLGDAFDYPVLSILKIDDELMLVASRNSDNNTLTVKRGINGTTQASHDAAAPILRFVPDDVISRMARRVANWFYKRRTQSRNDVERPIITASGIVLPAKFPAEIAETMNGYRYAGFN